MAIASRPNALRPYRRRLLGFVLLGVVAAQAASLAQAQTAAADVGACTMLSDPSAQRTCLESARQLRPATTFDPSTPQGTVQHPAARVAIGPHSSGAKSKKHPNGVPAKPTAEAAEPEAPKEMP